MLGTFGVDLNLALVAELVDDVQGQEVPRLQLIAEGEKVSALGNRLLIGHDDDIARIEASYVGRRLGQDFGDHQAARQSVVILKKRKGLIAIEAEAEINPVLSTVVRRVWAILLLRVVFERAGRVLAVQSLDGLDKGLIADEVGVAIGGDALFTVDRKPMTAPSRLIAGAKRSLLLMRLALVKSA